MLRWARYAEVLAAFTGQHVNLPLNQAILQHYGFRSFYLDCSEMVAVPAWFAGNEYSDKLTVELCDDCDERTLFLRKRMASYDVAEGVGHLYVLDRAACDKVGLTDLTAIAIEVPEREPACSAPTSWDRPFPQRSAEKARIKPERLVPDDCNPAHGRVLDVEKHIPLLRDEYALHP